jgi:transcriptional regulator with XRE-family HTH domain
MPVIGEGGEEREPRTLADKLQRLRHLKTPPDGKPPSYEAMARAITQAGVPITAPHLWALANGKKTDVRMRHLEGLASYFGVPTSYFLDDEVAERLDPQLETLNNLKALGLLDISVKLGREAYGLSPASLDAVLAMINHLRQVEGRRPEDEEKEEESS